MVKNINLLFLDFDLSYHLFIYVFRKFTNEIISNIIVMFLESLQFVQKPLGCSLVSLYLVLVLKNYYQIWNHKPWNYVTETNFLES